MVRTGDGEDLGPVADGGNLDAGALLDTQREITFKIRDRTILRTAFDDARSDDTRTVCAIAPKPIRSSTNEAKSLLFMLQNFWLVVDE